MRIVIVKALRELTLYSGGHALYRCRIALGVHPIGAKLKEGDGRTPEGMYRICLVKPNGKFGRSLGLSYPNCQDVARALNASEIDSATYAAIAAAHAECRRPPWGTPLGGEIYLHEGGTLTDWTQGCVALDTRDMDAVFPHWPEIDAVELLP